MSKQADELSPRARIGLGVLMVAVGLFPMLSAFDLGPLGTEDINGPPWLAFIAGAVFCLGGLAGAAGPRLRNHPLGFLVVFVLLAGFAAMGNWIAFGPGTRGCTVSLGGMFPNSRAVSHLACRGAFGIGALILNGLLVMMLAQGLVRVLGPGRLASWVERVGNGTLLVSLAPILLPLLFFLLIKAFFEAVGAYARTGRWPRNEAFIERMRLTKERARDRP